ncbi:MAG TPA: sensor histidine kinase [Acholeplasmatales bacterium]|mgnify:FL=1|nr:putative alkaline phosphatase synthesis sensor protein PhoR [Staphylococcus sp. CAG:324]HAR57590.1 sensor histidine kinase [Acholeplasmatales bacterium]
MKKRILFVFIIIIFTSTFIFSIISSRIYYEKFLEDAKNNLYIYMNQYSEEFSWDVAGAESYSRKLNGVRVTFIDKNGEVVGDSEENLPLDNHLNREEVKIASLEGEGFAIRKSDTLAQQMVYFCKSVNDGYVRVAVKTSTYSQIFIDSIPSLIWFFIIEIIVCLLFTWILVDYIIKPIEKLSIEGASGQKVSSTYPEFSQIVKIINNMNERIDDKISKIKEDKKIENIVLNNMEHGIIILGLDNHLILANNIVNELFGYSEVGENLPFFKDDQEILEGIEQEEQFLFYRKKNDKEYAIRFTKSENAKVILVTDVTEIKRMENSKNDFIANVTHEMNTPLTSIKGFAEMILTGNLDKEKIQKSCEIILKQTNRLSNLIKNIIHYSLLESDNLPNYPVCISTILIDILHNFEAVFPEKNLKVTTLIEENLFILSRTEKIFEIISNILTNAIKYNKINGEIEIHLKKDDDKIILKIKDTGHGIKQGDLDKIFDRFYTIDKSHNEHSTGFGLGLAIVKKIINQSGWKISVESEYEKYTMFTVEFSPIMK